MTKLILVTGGAGSIGSSIVRNLLSFNPKMIRILDNNETGLFDLEQDLSTDKIRPFVGDIRDEDRLALAFEGVDIIFHAAALKHVPLCEYNSFDAVKTNIIVTQNVIRAAYNANVKKVIFISTDKAVNPSNVMGSTKLLAENLTVSANYFIGDKDICFSCVRFGNVLDSRGSVIPLFKKQIRKGGPVTVTDPNMTRFVMSIDNAVELVLQAAIISRFGEIFILKMPALRIGELAEVMVEYYGHLYGVDPKKIKIKTVGKRIGEKIYEELMTETEAEYGYENDQMFMVLPQTIKDMEKLRYIKPGVKYKENFKKTKKKIYTSDNTIFLTKKEIKKILEEIEIC